ncbi:MAG: hypothetical protein MUC86_14440 [Burkholderiaceae bacterium]|nr:hypothetical protein [Burkholderiaceae bacterium]MCU0940296.1 hypothetical protein [Burkholderiaceae bacterium]
MPRTGFVPADGPPAWTSGTLFPQASRKAVAAASGAEAARLRGALAQVTEQVRSEKLGEVAAEFDGIHDIERARRVG